MTSEGAEQQGRHFVKILIGSCLLLAVPSGGYAMGWLERKMSGEKFWEDLEKAKPLIKQRADAALKHLGYDPAQLTASVSPLGEDEAVWVVKYWETPPKDFYLAVAKNGDLEVHLNHRGEVKRIVKYEGKQEQLLYGKDERIFNGMTQEQVRERLGAPDYKGRPPRYIRKEVADTMWKYQQNSDRTMTIHVYFKDNEVSSVSYFGE